ERQRKKQASGVVQLSRWLSQSLVQFNERHVFLPGGLVGKGQVLQGKAGDMRLAWWHPFQRGTGALQARLCLPCKELKVAPADRYQRTQEPGWWVIWLTRIAVTGC